MWWHYAHPMWGLGFIFPLLGFIFMLVIIFLLVQCLRGRGSMCGFRRDVDEIAALRKEVEEMRKELEQLRKGNRRT